LRIEGSNLAAANFNFQVLSFWASPTESLTDSQSIRKREQKSLCGNQSRWKRDSTHHSSHNWAVAIGERQEEEKKKKERSGGIIWSINLKCVKNAIFQYC
jgi:hypothetical protein